MIQEYFSKWFIVAIRSIATVFDFRDDFSLLANRLEPSISSLQAERAIKTLLKLGLLKKGADGRYSVSSATISTGDEAKSVALVKFHKEILGLAARAIDQCPPEARDISGVTVSVSEEGFKKIKGEIQRLRKTVMKIATADADEDRVYQLSTIFYPLSKNIQTGRKWGRS